MAFNTNSYINQASKTLTDRAIGAVGEPLAKALGSLKIGSIGSSLVGAGNSIDTIKSIASLRLDQIVDLYGSDLFDQLEIGGGRASSPQGLKSEVDVLGFLNGDPQTKIDNCEVTSPATMLNYPADLGEYFLSIQFMDYHRPSPTKAPIVTNSKTINLPLPESLIDYNGVQFSTPDLGVVGTIADLMDNANEGEATNIGIRLSVGAAREAGKATGRGTTTSIGKRIGARTIAGALADNVGVIAEQATGAILNPNITTAFRGPSLRKFTMKWEFSPNNPKESETLKKIVDEIRKRELPGMSFADSVAILSYPQMCQLTLHPINDLIKYKRMVIESANINYSPQGMPSFFKGTKLPVFTGLEIQFLEIEYFLSEDYGGADLYAKGTSGRGAGNDFKNIIQGITNKGTEITKEALKSE